MEYAALKGTDKPREVLECGGESSLHDVLCAVLVSADAIFEELRRIRTMIEKDGGL